MKHRFGALCLTLCLLFAMLPSASAAAGYTDVPGDSWAVSVIESAAQYDLMGGIGNNMFGYGQSVTKAQFVTVITRMFGWETATPTAPSFTDVPADHWGYGYVETALAHDVMDLHPAFSPDAPITRQEMAVMLVRALGYRPIAERGADFFSLPFTDVSEQVGYIGVAYDIGMINGTSATTFSPGETATREQAAAMLVRVYEQMTRPTDWLHGFYAFSAYSQRYVTDEMQAVSLGWSTMAFDPETGPWLNATSHGENYRRVPDGYESITSYLEQNGTKAHLDVYMDNTIPVTMPDGRESNTLTETLSNPAFRTQAVQSIMSEATKVYAEIGKSPYSGVTIDFENIKAELKDAFTAFISELSAQLKAQDMTLYIAVQPTMYFGGFDYKALGGLVDKIIIMAHDYNAVSLTEFVGTSNWHTTTALTPITKVYETLRTLTDSETGVQDKSKIALAISFSSLGWEISEDGKLLSGTPVRPAPGTVHTRLNQPDTEHHWSSAYMNPYSIYHTEEGARYYLWYEDARSVNEKIRLARMFGITGVSLWRIGTIPDFAGYDVWNNLID